MQALAPEVRPRIMMVTFGSVIEPRGGSQVRSRLLAETLTGFGAPPAIVSTSEPAGDLPPWARELHVPRRKPRLGFSVEFARLIREVASRSDIIIMGNAMFMPALLWSRTRLPMIWDANECQPLHYSRLPQSFEVRLRWLVWMLLERSAARRCVVLVAIGAHESTWWVRIHPGLRDKVAVVDHMPFTLTPGDSDPKAALEAHLGQRPQRPILLFVGTLLAKHNAAAANWLLEELAPRLPKDATLVLCGPGTERLHPTGANCPVVCLGAIEDIDGLIVASDFCLAPLAAGAGVKTKVLHYLVHGKPVIGTPVAFEGVEGAPGLYAAPLDELVQLINQLVSGWEPTAPVGERVNAQLTWIEAKHGRRHVAHQWRYVLNCANIL